MATAPSTGKLIYHITSIDNLPSILKFGLLFENAYYKTAIYTLLTLLIQKS